MRVICATVLLTALSLVSACTRQTPALTALASPPAAVQVAPSTTTSAQLPVATTTQMPPQARMQTNTPRPSPTAAPTASPEPSPVVVAQWFEESQDCWSSPSCVSYAFEIENPGGTPLVADYRVHAKVMKEPARSRDYQTRRDMAEIITEWNWVPLTAPGGRTAVARKMDIPDTVVRVVGVTIEIARSDRSTDLEAPVPPAKSVSILKSEEGYAATGILANPSKDTLTEIEMIALAFDDAGQILSWGLDLTAFLQPGEQGVRFDFDSTTAPAAVRAYGGAEPEEYSLSLLYRYGSPEPDPEVTGTCFVQQDSELTYVFVLENPGSEDLDTRYVVTAYDSAGRVIGVISYGAVTFLPYGVRHGVADKMDLATGNVPITRIDVKVRRFGRMGLVPPVPRFEHIRYAVRGGNKGEVTAQVTNPDPDLPIWQFTAVAVTYDSEGEINGGGSVILPDLEPGAKASVRIPVVSAGTVATVELLPEFMVDLLFHPDQAMTAPAQAARLHVFAGPTLP